MPGRVRRIRQTLWRGLRLRCPACGRALIFRAPFRIKHHCSSCGALFEREQGYFVGAICVNMLVTELLLFPAYFICLVTIPQSHWAIFTTLCALAVILPLAFYHHSWGLWLSFDHLISPLPTRPPL